MHLTPLQRSQQSQNTHVVIVFSRNSVPLVPLIAASASSLFAYSIKA